MKKNVDRFTDRVVDYEKYRPSYPNQILSLLTREIGFNKDWLVADIGSGTGISTKLFVDNGNNTFGVEPNQAMREACIHHFKKNRNFIAVNATAEDTKIDDHCIDLIFAGQSFHWFDKVKTKAEFQRILKPEGHIVLVWNQRSPEDEFQRAYEEFLVKHIPEYQTVTQKNITDEHIHEFFVPKDIRKFSLPNQQTFDLKAFFGRVKSSSYFPNEESESKRLYEGLRELFDEYAIDKRLVFNYQTDIYIA
ncbi:class I SAM-dependent methyltransferase [Sphingobacterium spiritivorum]|uniref:class I SAM-dependent methyltransferase n=1 Tax=Sphingobacterium spiritivorum TaxID=258 RepID=UPI001918EEF1|nr:class I SAM-dependent methyltransferase [Sphingobacterium spiritivorum]QQS96558.1 class I SAM-dependent methyltransferase [Sphingobacterium spiritivorum]